MKLSESVKPISYSKNHATKAVLQNIVSYEQTEESLALLKVLIQSSKSIQDGRSKPIKKAFSDVRKQIK